MTRKDKTYKKANKWKVNSNTTQPHGSRSSAAGPPVGGSRWGSEARRPRRGGVHRAGGRLSAEARGGGQQLQSRGRRSPRGRARNPAAARGLGESREARAGFWAFAGCPARALGDAREGVAAGSPRASAAALSVLGLRQLPCARAREPRRCPAPRPRGDAA